MSDNERVEEVGYCKCDGCLAEPNPTLRCPRCGRLSDIPNRYAPAQAWTNDVCAPCAEYMLTEETP